MKHVELDRLRTALEHAQAEHLTAKNIFQESIKVGRGKDPAPLENILAAIHCLNIAHERYRLALKRYNEALLGITRIA